MRERRPGGRGRCGKSGSDPEARHEFLVDRERHRGGKLIRRVCARRFDGRIDLARTPCVVIEYESLHLLDGHADLVILDETRSTMSSIVSKTNGRDGSFINTNFTALEDLGVRARKVLCMDADLSFDGCVQ